MENEARIFSGALFSHIRTAAGEFQTHSQQQDNFTDQLRGHVTIENAGDTISIYYTNYVLRFFSVSSLCMRKTCLFHSDISVSH